MAHFVISYDLHRRRDYRDLYQLLESWKAVRLLESVWLADLIGPAETVKELVLKTLDSDDSVAVLELKPGAQWAAAREKPGARAWLMKRLPRAF